MRLINLIANKSFTFANTKAKNIFPIIFINNKVTKNKIYFFMTKLFRFQIATKPNYYSKCIEAILLL